MSCKCQNCGNNYKVDLIISDDLWEKIKPLNKPKGAGMLCGKCIMEKIEKISDYDFWFLTKRRKKEKTKLISADFVKGYLDGCIMKWRKELGISRTMEDILVAECYIDAYQSVRISLLGELLQNEEE